MFIVAACGDDDDDDAAEAEATAAQGFEVPDVPIDGDARRGRGRGQPRRLAGLRRGRLDRPEGRLGERTSRRTAGCKVNVKVGNTSDEMVTLMRTGQLRRRLGVRRRVAAPDRRRRRRAGQHRPDPELRGRLRRAQGQAVQLRRRPVPTASRTAAARTCSMYRTDEVKPAPDSWSVVWDENSPYKGKVTAYDIADLHRRRGALPEGHAARPGDHEPLRARREAVRRGRRRC